MIRTDIYGVGASPDILIMKFSGIKKCFDVKTM